MNTFVERLKSISIRETEKEAERNWKMALLATRQQRLKALLEERDREHLRERNFSSASCFGNPLLRMNE